jgi:hypothetical protein
MTVALDAVRERAKLDEAGLAALTVLIAGRDGEALEGESGRAALAELRAAGALEGDWPAPWVARLLAPVAAPALRAVADVHAGGRLAVVATAWASRDGCLLGTLTSDGATELAPIDPALLPSAFAREVDLGPRPAPDDREPITASVAQVEAAEAARGDDALGRVMAARRSSWRVTVADDHGTRSLAAVDAAHLGLWLVEPEPGDRARLVPTTAGEASERLARLFG